MRDDAIEPRGKTPRWKTTPRHSSRRQNRAEEARSLRREEPEGVVGTDEIKGETTFPLLPGKEFFSLAAALEGA
jgi:hypothetical protein